MSIHDLSHFFCSNCGKAIPDRDLEKLVKVKLRNAEKLGLICGDYISKKEESKKKRGTLIIMSQFKIKL